MSDASSSPPPIYTPLTSSDLAALPIPPWRVKSILPQQGLAVIFGPSGSGKSFLATDLAAAIAQGNDWFNLRVRQAPVLYVALEGEGGFPKRILAWQQYNETQLPSDLRFILSQPFDITDPVHVRQLATVVKRQSVVIIDTLNRSSGGNDENTSEGMGSVLAGCKLLQELTNCLVILIHHTGKDETKGMRGHSSLLAAVDAAIEVKRGDDSTRSWLVAKAKDDSDGAEYFFKLDIERLGTDEDGDLITSCAISPTTEAAPPRAIPKGMPLKGNQKAVLAIVEPLLVDGPIPYDDALQAAIQALEPTVDSRHRANRAKAALQGLINIKRLVLIGNDIARP